ncbi:VOC family protein [Pendulispora rubella]|uniref:VOC family protein n=1 Tax=Pendulispora rubella TaxID=2741070 RepID=A0ABZ2L545_9BACT
MRIAFIDHVQLAMPSGREDEARAFYQGILGIPEQAKPAHLAKRGGAWFERGTLKVHIGVEKDFRAATKAHVAFIVEGLFELVSRCKAAGYRVTTDEPLEGFERVYIYDPFGNRLEFMEPTSTWSG